MRGWLHNRIYKKGGYTLAEVLIVVGIIAILSAVSFPAVINMRNSLRQGELDEKAREIFTAAQNQLSGLRLCGSLPGPDSDSPDGGTDSLDGGTDSTDSGTDSLDGGTDSTDSTGLRELDESFTPSDYVENRGEKPDTYAICQGDKTFSWMDDTAFPPELVKADGGSYVIEYNRETGTVYAVFYWEEKGGVFQKDSLFSYPKNFNQYDSLYLRGTSDKENRMVPSVGYYGGESGMLVEGKEDLEFEVSLRNEEELQVTVSMGLELWDGTIFRISIQSKTDPEHSQAYTYRLQGGNLTSEEDPSWINHIGTAVDAAGGTEGGDPQYIITLDSLREGMHFADNFPGITAGDDLRISVTGYGTRGDKLYIPQVRTVEINSLFAGLREGDGRGQDVYIENGRHLQNLSYEVSGLGTGRTGGMSDYRPLRARLNRDIDWTENVYKSEAGSRSWDQVCTRWGSGKQVNFYPISNDKTGLMEFEGNGHVVRNLHVTQSAVLDIGTSRYGCAGLFGYMEGGTGADDLVKIQNLSLVNPLIDIGTPPDGTSGSYAGSLAGYLRGADLKKCGAYIDGDSGETVSVSQRYNECGVISQGSFAGGLAGEGWDMKAAGSFASLRVKAGETAGGFAGKLSGLSQVDSCCSGGHTDNGSYSQDNPNVSGGAAAGGFAGNIDNGVTVTRSFSNCSVKGTACGPFVGSSNVADVQGSITWTYALGSVFMPEGVEANSIGCGEPDALPDNGAVILDHAGTHPYDEIYRADGAVFYPFPTWMKSYHGDWAGANRTGLVYYEKYQAETEGVEGEYGFWSPGEDGYDSLRKEEPEEPVVPVRSDGYGYLGSSDQSHVRVVTGKPGQDIELTCVKVNNQGKVQYLYVLPWDGVIHKPFSDFNNSNGHKNEQFYDTLKLEIDGTPISFRYNPHFAKAIALNEEEAQTAPDDAVIRTARHLYELAYEFNSGSKNNEEYWDAPWNYRQERDIDYETYDLSTYDAAEIAGRKKDVFRQGVIGDTGANDVTGAAKGAFFKTYDGGGHSISNLRIQRDSGDAALFGTIGRSETGTGNGEEISGSVKDLVLINPVMTAAKGGSDGTGGGNGTGGSKGTGGGNGTGGGKKGESAGVAVHNQGIISNVSVISPKIYSEKGSAAGFVVYNEGGIFGSYVIPEQPGYETEEERYHHRYDDSQSVIVNNYTNALVTSPTQAAGFVNHNASSIIRCAAIAAVTAGVYDEETGAVEPSSKGQAAGFVNENRGLVKVSYANCYTAGQMAAGFVNRNAASSEISSCYALRRVTSVASGGYAAGFAGEDATGSIRDSYAAVSNGYCGDYGISGGQIYFEGSMYTAAPPKLYPFSGSPCGSDCYYMSWSENYAKTGGTVYGEAVTYRQLRDSVAVEDLSGADREGLDTEAFSLWMASVYPFPKAPELTQYGDWPSYEYVGAEMAYFEIYKEGDSYSAGFYNNSLGLDTLEDGRKIFMDGYGLLLDEGYVDMDDINVKASIQGQEGRPEPKAYLSWNVNSDHGSSGQCDINDLMCVFDLKDNEGRVFSEAEFHGNVSYHTNTTEERKDFVKDSGCGDKPVELNLDGRDGRYYFRILPTEAVAANAYVEDGSVYQELNLTVASGYEDGRSGQESRTFYYCPHFAQSAIGVDERPEEPEELLVRTSRQLCTLGCENNYPDNGISSYYGYTFRQRQDIPLGKDNEYTYYYGGASMTRSDMEQWQDYRWFNSSIGNETHYFTGTYLGDGCRITGLGAWSGGGDLPDFNNQTRFNADAPLFGYLNGRVESLVLETSSVSGGDSVFCSVADHAHIKDVTASNIKLHPGEGPCGILAGEVKGDTVIEACRMEDCSVASDDVSWAGCAVGRMCSGSVEDLTLTGNIYVRGLRAVGGVAGQIRSDAAVDLTGISMEGTADISQAKANYGVGENNILYNAAGLIAGLCEVNQPVTMDGIRLIGMAAGSLTGTAAGSLTGAESGDGLLKVKNGSDCSSYVGGLLVGSLYKSSASADNVLSVGDVTVRNALLLTDEISSVGGMPLCYYGGIAGHVKNVNIRALSGQKTWDFKGSRIMAAASKAGADSAAAGLVGKCAATASVTLPDLVLLPDITVRAADSSMLAGGVLGRAAKAVTVGPESGVRSVVHPGTITADGCRNAGGLTAELTDNTEFRNIAVEGGWIQASGSAGAVAGNVKTSKRIAGLSASGTYITGIPMADAGISDSGSLGGFAGTIDSGTVEDSYASVMIEGRGDAPAGGFVGLMNGGTVNRCYASGNTMGCSDVGGFIGRADRAGFLRSCYASGDVYMLEAPAAPAGIGGFAGSLNNLGDGSVAISGCYSLGRVPEGLPGPVAAGGFTGYPEESGAAFTEVDGMIASLIDMMKKAEVHNRTVNQNGEKVWDLRDQIQMDASTIGMLDAGGNAAMVYNILGYPYYPNVLKKGVTGSGRADKTVMNDAYDRILRVIDGVSVLTDPRIQADYSTNTDFEAGSNNSYYENFYEKSQSSGLMTLWRIEGGYLYWINGEVKTGSCTIFRVPLEVYDTAITSGVLPEDRMALIEVNDNQKVVSFNSSYSTTYLVLKPGPTGWRVSGISDCFFLREDGTSGRDAYNASYGGIAGMIEPWSVASFEDEMAKEIAWGTARLAEMMPDPGNTSQDYSGYPYPMLPHAGAGVSVLNHTGQWPRAYHPVCR